MIEVAEFGGEGEAGSYWSRADGTTSIAEVTAVAKSVGEARPLGIRVPRRNLNSQRVPVKLDLIGAGRVARLIKPPLQQP